MKTLVVLLVAVSSSGSLVEAQSTVRRARSMGWPLQQQIRPDDRVLILESGDSPPLAVKLPDGDAAIHAMTDYTDVAVVVTVTNKRSHITAKGNWVTSVVTGDVEKILKPHALFRVTEGDSIDFVEDGGIVQIGQTEVRAVVPWSQPLEINGRYLVFAKLDEGRLIQNGASIYEFAGPHLKRLMPHETAERNGLEEPVFDEVLKRIEEHVRRGRR